MERALNGMYEEELRRWAESLGMSAFRGSQLFHFFHVERGHDLHQATSLPRSLRERSGALPIRTAEVAMRYQSRDGSAKYLLRLQDGAHIETVFMPYDDRTTLCVSSQVGCKMGCTFCASTKAPFVRNLQAEEILEQVYAVEREEGVPVDRIVLMGIGEPMDNYDEVLRFIHLVTDPEGKNLGQRHITLSTSGIVPGIERLSREGLQINLAISLHATSDERRVRTMPVARRYRIEEILRAVDHFFEQTGRRVSFEYALIRGENDRPEDAAWISSHLRGAGYHVNLIPLNEIREYDGEAADARAMKAFSSLLEANGVHVSVRQRRGDDISAACGQLRVLYEEVGRDA